MSDPTVQSLADQINALTARLDDVTRALRTHGADINRLGELTSPFSARIAALETGKFASITSEMVDVGAPLTDGLLQVKDSDGTDTIALDGAVGRISTEKISNRTGRGVVCESGLVVDTIASTKGAAGIIEVNAAQIQIHGSDLILDGRSKQIGAKPPFRALVDMGDQLVINFNGDYQKGTLVDSDLTVTKTVFATLRPPGGDCAEQFEVASDIAAEPGTVMIIGADGALEPCKTAYDARAAGVVSGAGDLQPGLVLNEKEGTNRAAIALIGTVYCKVDADGAPISPGDLLTTSTTPGHAMKAIDLARSLGAIIGKALKPLHEGTGLIPILVTPR